MLKLITLKINLNCRILNEHRPPNKHWGFWGLFSNLLQLSNQTCFCDTAINECTSAVSVKPSLKLEYQEHLATGFLKLTHSPSCLNWLEFVALLEFVVLSSVMVTLPIALETPKCVISVRNYTSDQTPNHNTVAVSPFLFLLVVIFASCHYFLLPFLLVALFTVNHKMFSHLSRLELWMGQASYLESEWCWAKLGKASSMVPPWLSTEAVWIEFKLCTYQANRPMLYCYSMYTLPG